MPAPCVDAWCYVYYVTIIRIYFLISELKRESSKYEAIGNIVPNPKELGK